MNSQESKSQNEIEVIINIALEGKTIPEEEKLYVNT
jgi:hypothetical protein